MKPFPTKRGDSAPLSNPQKAYLSGLAKKAWTLLRQNGATDESEKEYRQRESIGLVGRRVSEALNGDFEALEAHFLAASGQSGRAFEKAMKADSNDARQALWKLRGLLQKHGKAEDYAAKIMRDKFKTTLPEATAKQVWSVFFDCQRNFKKQTATPAGATAQRWDIAADDTSIPF